jgi:hypothetical protein
MVTYAAQIFDKSSDGQGAVDVGVNVHYDKVSWVTRGFEPLYTKVTIPGLRGDTTLVRANPLVDEGHVEDKRLLMDIGFYQADVLNNLDFGLVLHNIFGYSWGRERPDSLRVRYKLDTALANIDPITAQSDSVWIDSACYVNEYANTDGWTDGYYRRLTIGGAFHSSIIKGKVALVVPADLEFIGIFDHSDHRSTGVMFRCGIEATIAERVALRFGYGREPERVERGATPENRNVFTGGAGFHYNGIGADVYLGTGGWGVGASVNF